MSDSIDWEHFRFPQRPIGYYLEEARAEEQEREKTHDARQGEDDGEGEGEGGDEGAPAPSWVYHPHKKTLQNVSRKRQIKLSNLDTNAKIVRLIEAIEARLPDEENASLLSALQDAAKDCYQLPLHEVISNHRFQSLTWKSGAEEVFSSSATSGQEEPVRHLPLHR